MSASSSSSNSNSRSHSHSPTPNLDPDPNFTQPPFTTAAVAAHRDPPPPDPYHQAYYELSYLSPDTPYFDEAITAYRSSPSPSPSPLPLPNNSFLDNILNPVAHSHSQPTESNHLPFGYRQRISPRTRRPRSPVLQTHRAAMSPSRPPRLPNGYVDLTTPDPAPARRKRHSVTPGPSSKRVRLNDASAATTAAAAQEPASSDTKIEAIDLSDDKANVAEIMQKQRADAVKAQTKPEEKPTTFNSFTCVICMDTPTDITATSCGHLFCHTCLMEALIAGENRSGPNEPKKSQCPVCRKFINRKKDADIIPLLMKKGMATQPRKSSVKAQVIIEDEHPFKGFHQQAAKRNPFMNGGRTSRNLTQQQIWDMEAIIRPRFQPPVININHDPWRPQQQDMEVDMTSYGRTQPQAMNPNDNPFRGYQQQIRNNNAMYNIRSQPQATNQNQNPSRGTQLQAKNHESIVPSARRRASRHDAEDVWEI